MAQVIILVTLLINDVNTNYSGVCNANEVENTNNDNQHYRHTFNATFRLLRLDYDSGSFADVAMG